MKNLVFYLFFGVSIIILINMYNFSFYPYIVLPNLILCLGILLILSLDRTTDSEPFGDTYYDYDVENPNALVSGRPVGGTVYASSGEKVGGLGGLGWII